MKNLRALLEQSLDHKRHPIGEVLIPIVGSQTGVSKRGYPYLKEDTYELLRDRVPHILGMGLRVLDCLDHFDDIVSQSETSLTTDMLEHYQRAVQVVRTVTRTAAITAPSDLWLLRHVLTGLQDSGLSAALLSEEGCTLEGVSQRQLLPEEIEIDFSFLLSRGLLREHKGIWRVADNAAARAVLTRAWPEVFGGGQRLASLWSSAFKRPDEFQQWELLERIVGDLPCREYIAQESWVPLPEEIELGYRLLPLVLGLHATELGARVVNARSFLARDCVGLPDSMLQGIAGLLVTTGLARPGGEAGEWPLTSLGQRVLERGVGPFGIIEAYHSYMVHLPSIWAAGKQHVAVSRATNIAASQIANARSFETVNNVIDRFCADTRHSMGVYVEHALGRGEASRQRFERLKASDSEGTCVFVGADLEDAAIDAAMEEQQRGVLPAEMRFVRGADIGKPEILTLAMREWGIPTEGAFMVVGNGFHEARCQTDETMTEVFKGYHDAGLIIVFTEESALLDDDLLATAWNTYHAGFRYVHNRSGQMLRPADPAPEPLVGKPLRASWSHCAGQAGYVRVEQYCSRSRTIFPYRPRSGRNPAISVNHFLVPGPLAERLGLKG